MAFSLDYYRRPLRNLGILNSIAVKAADLRMRSLPKLDLVRLRAPRVGSVLCRAHTSDRAVFTQIFVEREYRCLDEVLEPGLIIDCGANVGYSSAYFLATYPRAHLIAVEPDPGNFSLLTRNLARYRARTTLVQSAVWSSAAGLVMSEKKFGDGREWSYTVRETMPGETPGMLAVGIGELLKRSGFDRISILKIDIEGAEIEVFRSTCFEDWIGKVDHIVIELHGPVCEAAVMKVLVERGGVVSKCEELTVCSFRPDRRLRQ